MIALKGILTAKTAFMVGSGDDEGSDSDILRTGDGEVFIPGTSLAGICRSYLEESNKSIDIDNIFGTIKNKEENYTCRSIEKTDFFIIKDKDIYFLSADDKTWKLKRFNVETEFEENYSLEFERKDWLNNEYKILKMGEYLDNIYLIFSVANRIDIVNVDFKVKKVKNSFLGMKQNIFFNRKQVEVYDNFLVMRDVKSEKVYVYITNLVKDKDKLVVTKNKKDYIKLGQFLTTQNKDKIYELK